MVVLKGLFPVFLRLGRQGRVAEVVFSEVISCGGEAGGVGSEITPLETVLGDVSIGRSELVLRVVAGHEAQVARHGLILGRQRLLFK